MSFNIDDPLAGILSDGSDDSFFDDDVLGKKKASKTKSTVTPDKKKSVFDLEPEKNINSLADTKKELFDISKSESFKTDKVAPPSFKAVSPAPFKKALSKESITTQQGDNKSKIVTDASKSPGKPKISASADTLDILNELTVAKKGSAKTAERGKSSQSLLDDILGGTSSKQSSSQIKPPSTAKIPQDFDFDSLLGKNESKPSVTSKTAQASTVRPDKIVKEEKVAKKSKTTDDWLGIFYDKEQEKEVSDMPSWLGGDTKKSSVTEADKVVEHSPEVAKREEQIPVQLESKTKAYENEQRKENVLDPLMIRPTVLQNSNEDLTAEGAALYLQEQESQLMVALQLKAQEEKLAAMQLRQKESQRLQREAAVAHHEQLDAMLQRQTHHRIQMQGIINTHQERITERIKALLGTVNVEEGQNPIDEDNVVVADRKESPHVKEKKQLLQLIQSLQENHDKEIDLMETSYRRQLAFIEVSLSQSEERMKEESDKLIKYYSEKINWLEEHHLLFKKLSEDNLTSLVDQHKAENEMLRQQHLENIKVLQEHHAALMENVKNAVKQEQNLIQDSVGFSSKLQELVSDVKESKTQCQQLMDKVQSITDKAQVDLDRSLQARELQLNDMIQQLKVDRENFEKEKTESRNMVNLLEKRLKQMTTMIEEESAALKQNKMEFEFEKATFSKQTEFAKNVLKKQDEELKMLKEDMLKEYQEKASKINEEISKAEKDSVAIIKEKSSIQNIKQDLEKMKAELQAQLEEVSEDRLKINLEKQQMHMEEQRIMAKNRDLEMLAKAAIEKQSQADKKYSEAEFIQSKYEERIRRIQEHVVSLNAREKQIAKEKVALSRERLSLHNERKKIENTQQCSLCRSAQYVPQYDFESVYPEKYLNVSVSRDHGEGNASSAMNAIANDIVSLQFSKNYDFGHKYDMNSAINERTTSYDFQTMQNTESASGAFKDYNMDPKFMMLKLDVQQVLSNLDEGKKDDANLSNENA